MVAPELPPPAPEFNVRVAKPLPNPVTPQFEPLPIPATPPPFTLMTPLPTPELTNLAELPPALPPQVPIERQNPIARPDEPHRNSVQTPGTPAVQTARLPFASGSDATKGGGHPSIIPKTTYRLEFEANSAELPESAQPLLEHLAALMDQDQNVRLKLRSYASGSMDDPVAARKLSLQRAIKSRGVLTARGITSTRIDILALGINDTDEAGAPPDRIDITPVN